MQFSMVGRCVFGEDDVVAEWMNKRFGGKGRPADSVSVGIVDRDMNLIGAFQWFNVRDRDIEFSVVVNDPRAITRATLRAVFAYPFIQLRLPRVTAEIPLADKQTVQLAYRFGMTREGVKRSAHERGDVGVFGLLRSNCKILRNTK